MRVAAPGQISEISSGEATVVVAAAAAMMTWKLTRTSCELPLLLLLSSVVVCSVQCRAGGRRTHTHTGMDTSRRYGWMDMGEYTAISCARTYCIDTVTSC
jgi:hypothetical protein